jgi:RNA polymerase sigma factor for flagellar operon FliA
VYPQAQRQPPSPDATRLVDGMTRHQLCDKYQSKIVMLARRLASRLPDSVGISREDLASYGAIGLLEAFDHYDETQNIKFATYAEYRIRGSMLDALRANDTMSRRRRTLARRIQDASNTLAHKLGREPSAEEVAEVMDMDLDSYWAAMAKTEQVTLLSMDDKSSDDEDGLSLGETQVRDDGRDVLQLMLDQGTRDELKQAIMELPDRTRQCVLLYYGRNLTLTEIAKVFDLTPSRISQILSDARRRLRGKLEQGEDAEDGKENA